MNKDENEYTCRWPLTKHDLNQKQFNKYLGTRSVWQCGIVPRLDNKIPWLKVVHSIKDYTFDSPWELKQLRKHFFLLLLLFCLILVQTGHITEHFQ